MILHQAADAFLLALAAGLAWSGAIGAALTLTAASVFFAGMLCGTWLAPRLLDRLTGRQSAPHTPGEDIPATDTDGLSHQPTEPAYEEAA